MSHAISHAKAPRALHLAIVIGLVVAGFGGVCALFLGLMAPARPSPPQSTPSIQTYSGASRAPANPARADRDPAAPGRKF